MAAKKLSAYQKYLNRRERMINKGYFVAETMDEKGFEESVELARSEIGEGNLKTRRSAEQYVIEEGNRYFSKKQAKSLKMGINDMLRDKKILGDLYIELGKLYSNISKEKELECYQNGVRIYGELNII